MYLTKIQAIREADKLVTKLQNIIDKNPKKFCENYGQNELSKFQGKLCKLHYVDECDIMDKLLVIYAMRPNKKLLK